MTDAVIQTLITTLGTVVGTAITTLAVVRSRRSTKRDIRNVHEDVRRAIGEVPAEEPDAPRPSIIPPLSDRPAPSSNPRRRD